MKKLIILFTLVLLANCSFAQGSFGDIMGQVLSDTLNKKPVIFAKVWVERGASNFGATTDENGKFIIHSVPTGSYQLNIYNAGDSMDHAKFLTVLADGTTRLGKVYLHLGKGGVKSFKTVTVVGKDKDPLIDAVFGQTRISALDIKKSPAKNDIKELIESRSSEIQVSPEGKMIIRGGRAGDLTSYLDGVKLRQMYQIPSSAIGGVTIYTSAIPAKYGDTTGGVIIMQTKSYYDLYQAWKISLALAARAQQQ